MKLPLTFIVNQTYQSSTEESRIDGEYSETGFEFEDESMSLEELERHLESVGFVHPSSLPINNVRDYMTSECVENRDYFEKGIETTKSIHLSKVLDSEGNALTDDVASRLWANILYRQIDRSMGKDVESEIDCSAV